MVPLANRKVWNTIIKRRSFYSLILGVVIWLGLVSVSKDWDWIGLDWTCKLRYPIDIETELSVWVCEVVEKSEVEVCSWSCDLVSSTDT